MQRTFAPHRSFANLLGFGNRNAEAGEAGGEEDPNDFENWPIEEIILRLREDGVDVPPDSNPHDLIAFAKSFYVDAMPQRYATGGVEYTSLSGVQYIPRPKLKPNNNNNNNGAGGLTSNAEMEVRHDYFLVEDEPVMFESEMTEQERQLFRNQHGSMLSAGLADGLGADAQVEVEDVHEDFAFIDDGTRDIDPDSAAAANTRIKNEFQKPNLAVAKRFEMLNHPRRMNGKPYSVLWTNTGRFCFSRGRGILLRFIDPFLEGNTSELARYGIGISLHFKILKWLFWIFFALTLISLPQMVLNSVGGSQNVNFVTLDATTLGHLSVEVFTVEEGTENITRRFVNAPVPIPFSQCGTVSMTGNNSTLCEVDRDWLALFYTISDLVAMLVFYLGLKWMKYFIKVEGARITKHHITVEEYTIQAVRIPPNTTERELSKFFSELTGEPVHDVFLVQDNGELLSLYVKRGKVINKLWKQAAEIHLLKEERKSKPGQKRIFTDDKALQKRLDRAVRAYDKTYALFLDLNEQRARKSPGTKSLSAFITFETQAGFLKAMDLYPQNVWAKYRQPPELRLDRHKALKVRQAPPPTTILWENTHYGLASRRNRRLLTWCITAVMLAISVVVCFFTERERYNLKSSIFSGSCDVAESIYNSNNLTVYDLATTLGLLQGQDEDTLALAREDAELRNCFCSKLNFGEAVSSLVLGDSLCHEYYSIKSPQYTLTFVATLVIASINILLQHFIYLLSGFEKHHSIVNRELSIAGRAFIGIFINTGLILLMVNARLPGAEWEGSGQFSDFEPDWYPSVGTNIILTMTLNIVTPQLFPFITYSLFKSRQRSSVAYSQRELNERYLGSPFLLSYRTAQLCMTVFVTLLYSSGMPCLYPIACMTFFVAYYSDKFLLLRFYRTPPAYSERLALWFCDMLPYAIIIHLGFAVWMFSTVGVFWDGVTTQTNTVVVDYLGLGNFTQYVPDNGYNFASRLAMDHIVPLYAALFLMVVLNLLGFLFHSFDKLRSLCCARVTCGIFDDGVIKRRYLNPNYTDALAEGHLRGLVNYNILENPTYARALGIDARFAREHRHIASVHEASAVDLPVLPTSFKVIPHQVHVQNEAENRASRRLSEQQHRQSLVGDVGGAAAAATASARNSMRTSVRLDVGDLDGAAMEQQQSRPRVESTTRGARVGNAFFRPEELEESTPVASSAPAAATPSRRASTSAAPNRGRESQGLARLFTEDMS